MKDPDPEYGGLTHDVKINLTDVTVKIPEGFSKQVELKDGTIVVFDLPGIRSMDGLEIDDANEFDSTIDVFVRCVSSVCCGEDVYSRGETTEQEFREFFLDLDTAEFQELSNTFFTKIPALGIDVNLKRNDGTNVEVPIRGLASFL